MATSGGIPLHNVLCKSYYIISDMGTLFYFAESLQLAIRNERLYHQVGVYKLLAAITCTYTIVSPLRISCDSYEQFREY